MLSAALLTPPPHQVNIKPTFPGITPQHLVIQIQYKPTVCNALEFIQWLSQGIMVRLMKPFLLNENMCPPGVNKKHVPSRGE